MPKILHYGVSRTKTPIASGAALQTFFFEYSDPPLSEIPGSTPGITKISVPTVIA